MTASKAQFWVVTLAIFLILSLLLPFLLAYQGE